MSMAEGEKHNSKIKILNKTKIKNFKSMPA